MDRFPKLRRCACALFFGAAATVLIAWICALWMPSRFAFDPFENPAKGVETVDPDGEKGLHFQEVGFGWAYTSLRGYRYDDPLHGGAGVVWTGPYGGTYHRVAGWPFRALRSRVEVLDSQGGNSHPDGWWQEMADAGKSLPDYGPQRRRWKLPLSEIIHRGLASQDLPAWFHAGHNRRLPLIPMPLGFAVNTLLYAAPFFLAAWLINARAGKIPAATRRSRAHSV